MNSLSGLFMEENFPVQNMHHDWCRDVQELSGGESHIVMIIIANVQYGQSIGDGTQATVLTSRNNRMIYEVIGSVRNLV